jgi:Holliday junction resolvase RusA-like endonuclease
MVNSALWFEIDGEPKIQPRPRAFARMVNGRAVARVYDAGTAEEWKGRVVAATRERRPAEPFDGPIGVLIEFRMPRPKRLQRKKDPGHLLPCTSRPDIDNLAKAILDALQQDGWWLDDAQITELVLHKCYTTKGGRPGARIKIEVIDAVQEVAT